MSLNGWNYDEIKREAKARRKAGLNCTTRDLIALSPQNDPFYVGSKADLEKVRWFGDIWQRFGYTSGVHLRRVHYQLVSQDPPVVKPDGLLYDSERDYLTQLDYYKTYQGGNGTGA